ncbi:MAG: hypothetical protein KGJ21_02950 [Pseudomonadota bacterium]|nr:hypothetical protein [Pseudomonadota bacterium]
MYTQDPDRDEAGWSPWKWLASVLLAAGVAAGLVLWFKARSESKTSNTKPDRGESTIPVAEHLEQKMGWKRLGELSNEGCDRSEASLAEQFQRLLLQSPNAVSQRDEALLAKRSESVKPKFNCMDDVLDLEIGRRICAALARGEERGPLPSEVAVSLIPDTPEIASTKLALLNAAAEPAEMWRVKQQIARVRGYLEEGWKRGIQIQASGEVSGTSGRSQPIGDFLTFAAFLDEGYVEGREAKTNCIPLYTETEAHVALRLDALFRDRLFEQAFPEKDFPDLHHRLKGGPDGVRLAPSLEHAGRGENQMLKDVLEKINAERDMVKREFTGVAEKAAVDREYEFFADFFRILANKIPESPLLRQAEPKEPKPDGMSQVAPKREDLSRLIGLPVTPEAVSVPVQSLAQEHRAEAMPFRRNA